MVVSGGPGDRREQQTDMGGRLYVTFGDGEDERGWVRRRWAKMKKKNSVADDPPGRDLKNTPTPFHNRGEQQVI